MVCKEALKNPIFKTVSEVCQREQMETYVIGGYVRDYFLNRVHDMDIDIVTVGNGISPGSQNIGGVRQRI
jgi:poly(A) polymerase